MLFGETFLFAERKGYAFREMLLLAERKSYAFREMLLLAERKSYAFPAISIKIFAAMPPIRTRRHGREVSLRAFGKA